MKQIVFKIDGMHCGMCEAHVCDAIRRSLPNASKIKASHRQATASFQIEEGIDCKAAKEGIESQGYKVLNVREEEVKKGFFHR